MHTNANKCVSSGSESTGSGTLLALVHGRLEPTSAVVFLTKWFNHFFALTTTSVGQKVLKKKNKSCLSDSFRCNAASSKMLHFPVAITWRR